MGHDVLVYSDFYSNANFIEALIPGCAFADSLDVAKKFSPQIAYTQHHTTALNIRSTFPSIPIAHGILGVLPHLEMFPQVDLGINCFLPISEEAAQALPLDLINRASVSIFRNIIDDQLFTNLKSVNKVKGICCYSYKFSNEKYKQLEIAAIKRGYKLFDQRRKPGSIPYKDTPKILTLGDIVVASGRGAIEAMLCGKVPLIISECGDDGLVTPENFDTHMRTNFSGRTTSRHFNAESIGFELDLFRPDYGPELQDLARRYFGLRLRKNHIIEVFETLASTTPKNLPSEQIKKIKFISKAFDLQRTFAVTELKLRNSDNVINERPQQCEARLYVSEIVEGAHQNFTESRGAATLYTVSKQRQVVRLPLPHDLKPLTRIRLDPSNQPVGVLLHRLALLRADGSEAWDWDGDIQLFRNIGGLVVRETTEGLLLVCWNDDPQFELALPHDVMASLQPNDYLVVELTPRSLQDACADFLIQDDRLIAELRASATRNSCVGNKNIRAEAQSQFPCAASNLEKDTFLLKSELARRDQTIAEQSIRLTAMRDELLRAEAQLDLLKGVMLDCRDEDRL
jgi:hypothetical protein